MVSVRHVLVSWKRVFTMAIERAFAQRESCFWRCIVGNAKKKNYLRKNNHLQSLFVSK